LLIEELPESVPLPVSFGVAARAAGLAAADVALAMAAASIQGPGWAATRLLGLDPYLVAGVLTRMAPTLDEVAAEAARDGSALDWADLACLGAPLLEIGAEVHATWEVRLFAS
jgi:urease accessory protein